MEQPETKEEPSTVDTRLFVGSVRKAMAVMEAFDETEPAMSMTRIAAKTGLGRSAAQRFVYTLETLGYLRRDARTLEYRLSNRALLFARSILTSHAAIERAFPSMVKLAETFGETVSWLEYDAGQVVVLSSAPSPHRAAVVLPIGARFDALTSSSGHLFLADMRREIVVGMFEDAGPSVRARLGDLEADSYVDLVRSEAARGYALTEKDMDIGSMSLSVPVRDLHNQVVAAINVSVLRARTGPEKLLSEIVPALNELVQTLDADLFRGR